jgi:hypothetical protein
MRILVLLFCIGVFAAAGVGKEAAEPSRVLSREDRFEKAELAEARERATEFWFKAQGILTEESIRPERAFKAVRAIEGFAERDDPAQSFVYRAERAAIFAARCAAATRGHR